MNAAADVGTRAFVSTGRGPVVTAHTMVSTGHPLATAAGLRLLLDGGNAFDAAIGAAAVIAVVEPSSNQVGGDVFALCRPAATGIVEAVNASGPAPASAVLSGYADGIPTHGLRSATLPGAVAAWDAINERYGHMPLERVLAPAIVYASGGFPVDLALAGAISQSLETLSQFPATALVLSPAVARLDPAKRCHSPIWRRRSARSRPTARPAFTKARSPSACSKHRKCPAAIGRPTI